MRNFTKHIRHPGSNTKSTSLPGTGRKSTRPHKCVLECAENTTRVGTKPIKPPKPPGNVTKPTNPQELVENLQTARKYYKNWYQTY